MINFLSKTDLREYRGRTALLRIDLNIETGAPLDSYRVNAVIPTIKLLLKHKVKVVILSHRGRPDGNEKKYSLAPFGAIFAKKLKTPVDFVYAGRIGALQKAVGNSRAKIILVENLRFFPGEEINDPSFARELAKVGDFYVNDAFAVSHRKNASVCEITKYLPSFGGLLLEQEIKKLSLVMKNYKQPLTIVLGGAKVSDKIGIINYFLDKADYFLLGGGPANTFLAAQGSEIGDSLYEKDSLLFVKKLIDLPKIILPVDVRYQENRILDIGHATIRHYGEILSKARTIVWNGPMGLFEEKGFEDGTRAIWEAVIKNKKAMAVVGGGETTASLSLIRNSKLLIHRKNVFISTGGGAMLEFLSGKKLPGIVALNRGSNF